MIFHSKGQLRWFVYVSEIYREDWSFIWKKSWRDEKFLGLVHSIEFVDWDKVEELYSVYRVEFKWEWYMSDKWEFRFVLDDKNKLVFGEHCPIQVKASGIANFILKYKQIPAERPIKD